jgi:integrase
MREGRTRVEKFKHPELDNRYVSVIFVDNKLDMPSFMFLCNEAVTGGKRNGPAGKTSHRGRAYKIAELYDHLYDKGLTWQSAEEGDIEEIRNAMLHRNMKGEYKPEDYMIEGEKGKKQLLYERIENDSMNQKLSVWFKFYKYQVSKEMQMRMYLSTSMVEVPIRDGYNQHLYGKKIGKNTMIVERWDMMVNPSPKKLYFPALDLVEYEAFKTQLTKIDPVYATIAELAVGTGLRKGALLDVKPSFFKSMLKDINLGGKTFKDGFRPMEYENKGGNIEICKVPLKTIMEINHIYIAAEREDRKIRNGLKFGGDGEYMWYRNDGKKVEYHDLSAAFREASVAMGRTMGIDNITPHHLRHTFATWTVINGAKILGIDLMQLDSKMIPGLIKWLKIQLAHVSEETTTIYIVTAVLMMSPKSSGPLITSSMMNKGEVLKDLLEADAKIYFGAKYDSKKYVPLKWAAFKHFDMDSELINVLKKEIQKK